LRAVNDDFRVRVRLADNHRAVALAAALSSAHELEAGARGAAPVIVSVEGPELFAYAGSREQAEHSAELIRTVSGDNGWQAEFELTRWHPSAEEWEDVEKPLPRSDEEFAAEHALLVAREQAESAARGFAEYEVRVECHTHAETVKLAEILRSQHLPVVRRWRYLLLGAPDEDSAHQLADRVTQESPPGSTVTVEATLPAVAADGPRSRFAVFSNILG
jgi:hypothetical protein